MMERAEVEVVRGEITSLPQPRGKCSYETEAPSHAIIPRPLLPDHHKNELYSQGMLPHGVLLNDTSGSISANVLGEIV
jgi:hypothetical protein